MISLPLIVGSSHALGSCLIQYRQQGEKGMAIAGNNRLT
jgi:hypothetical protein